MSEFTCLVGTLVPEAYEIVPPLCEACERSIRSQSAVVADSIDHLRRYL